jgi:hypothetical protein
MIVEDHDMPDCPATCGYKSRLDREDFPFSQCYCIRQSVGSNYHRSFLKRSKIDISPNVKFCPMPVWNVNELDGARAKHPPNANDSCGRDRGHGDAIRFDRIE